MIRCHKSYLEARCRQRGYTLDEVMPCVVEQEGDQWTIDIDSPFYPRHARPGPGTELKALLKTIGIVASPNCSCNRRAQIMDEWGADECERRIDDISIWLAGEAKKRKLPYWEWAGRALIRLAIRRARKKGSK